MLQNEEGETSHALVANWAEGTRLLPLLANSSLESIIITDADGEKIELAGEEIINTVIAIVRDEATLILPDRDRSTLPTNIIEIGSN
ncbi:MAG: hypothetical protein U9R53_01415 [Chloroflexota bacterium]|nr:hypothetical protein [Chloroflexota bacterium]